MKIYNCDSVISVNVKYEKCECFHLKYDTTHLQSKAKESVEED